MADVIQFQCPACCVTLRVPLQAAGQHGPCPHCQQMIIAPDPDTNTAACQLAVEAPERPQPEPPQPKVPATSSFAPFQGVPIAAPEIPVSAPRPAQPKLPSTLPAALAVGVLAALLGFAGGYQSARLPQERPTPPKAPVTAQPIAAEHAPASPTLSAPKAVLDEFLATPDWRTRSRLVLSADRVTPSMETYYATHPDGPTIATRTMIEHCEANAVSNLMLVVFRVFTAECPTGFTVALAETADGWKVDWEPFVEFKDELFIEFVAGKSGMSGKFHLILLPSTSPSPSEEKSSYILSDPVKGREFLAFAQKGAETEKALEALTKEGVIATPVLELARRSKADGSFEIEILAVPSTNWRPDTK